MNPVAPTQRLASLDLLRGLALLGILTMNITLGLPGSARLIPTIAGGFSGLNFASWVAGYFLFDEKMLTLFSLLFGAGILLIGKKDRHPTRLFLRRQAVLLAIGLCHAYLIWDGDILVYYALCGPLAYLFRRQPPRRLVLIAFLFWLPSLVLSGVFGHFIGQSRAAAERIATHQARPGDPELAEIYTGLQPTTAAIAAEVHRVRTASYFELTARRIPDAAAFQLMVFPISFLWSITARMLIGMALFQLGILSGTRSPGFYRRLAFASYALGLPIVAAAMLSLLHRNFDPAFLFSIGLELNQFGSLFVAIGHLSLALWLYLTHRLDWIAPSLTAVGRLALTNYLSQSLVATTLFYGYGFALFGQLDRIQLNGVVLAIWILQLAISRWWITRFAYGPVEWLWRWLAYGTRPPFRLPRPA